MQKFLAIALLSTLPLPASADPADNAAAGAPLALTAHAAEAAPVDDGAFRFSAYWENDSSILKIINRTDRYYTNGIGGSFATHCEFAVDATQWIPFSQDFEGPFAHRRAVGLTVAQLMFTPQDIAAVDPPLTDHPYAGYLYVGAFFQRSNDTTLDHIQVDVGLVGPSSLAEDAQLWAHDTFDGDPVRGWDTQLDDEPTAQLYLRKKWKIALPDIVLNDIPVLGVELIPQAELAVGSIYRQISAAALMRIGYNLPRDFGPDRLTDIGSFTTPQFHREDAPSPWSWYGFVRVGGRAVNYDIFLDGNNAQPSRDVDRNPLVGEISAGLALEYRWKDVSIHAVYGQTHLTEQFDSQDGSHAYGQFTLGVRWRF